MKFIGWLTVIAAIFILGPIWSGYILSVLWTWFIMPVFHFAALSLPLAIGISGTVHFLTYQVPPKQQEKDTDPSEAVIAALMWSFLYPLYVLFASYIVHLFV